MNEVRTWCAMACSAALGCSAVRLLAPKEGIGKVFRLITVSFFLCCLLSPLLKFRFATELAVEYMPPEMVSQLVEERVNKQLTVQVKQAVRQITEEALAERKITAKNIEVVTDISEQGGIYIEQITVTVDKQSVPAAMVVREVLQKQLQTKVSVNAEE